MRRSYPYIGPDRIAARAAGLPPGVPVGSARDVLDWMGRADRESDRSGRVTATFVIDEGGRLRLANRRSEHVACSGGGRVLAAGEMTFSAGPGGIRVESVTNQSTGYCPEPESWPAVARALEAAGIEPPAGYAPGFEFRRCERCSAINLIKDQLYECSICGADLPALWNLDEVAASR
jgi:hypothetical protein